MCKIYSQVPSFNSISEVVYRHHQTPVASNSFSSQKDEENPSAENAASLEQSEVSLQEAILSARSQYEIDLVNDCAFGDNGRIFQYINHVLNQHSTGHYDPGLPSDFGRATLFNQFFHSVFSSSGPFPDPSSLPPLLLFYWTSWKLLSTMCLSVSLISVPKSL